MEDLSAAFLGLKPARLPHYEHWSCPDAETWITGIDHYDNPRRCRERMRELYPRLGLPVPETDEPIPRPLDVGPPASGGRKTVRWGDGQSWHWDWGRRFPDTESALAFSPLEQGDFTGLVVAEGKDYRDEEGLFRYYHAKYPRAWGATAPEGSSASVFFYNTMFMWPLLTFGWERFLEICLDDRFNRIMEEFAEINRRVFRVFARLPVNFVVCHDDIVTERGPVCSPAWMKRHLFPRYEEFWDIVRTAGKEVIFMADGRMDTCADDVLACGARGIITEPYTDFRAIARRHPGCFLAGEGDNRILMRDDPGGIEAMVRRMVETAGGCGGYAMCIGNHIPWNLPPSAVKRYLDLCESIARI